LSIKLISLIIDNRFDKYEHLRKEDLLVKLSSCIKEPLNYNLNSESFIPRSGNLRHPKIVEAFNLLGFELSRELKGHSNFSELLKDKYGHIANTKDDLLFEKINDLVTRRNDIAHGVNIDNILGITEFDDYIKFLEKYGEAIFETLVEKEVEYEAEFLCQKITNVKKIFNNRILCFEIEHGNIKVGDCVIIENSNSYFFKKVILKIQKNRETFDEINVTKKTDVGLDLGGDIKENQIFYIKKLDK